MSRKVPTRQGHARAKTNPAVATYVHASSDGGDRPELGSPRFFINAAPSEKAVAERALMRMRRELVAVMDANQDWRPSMDTLRAWVEGSIRKYNATPCPGLNGRTPASARRDA